MTRILKQSDINFIISELKAGRIVAFATDTVFGVGVIYNNYQAVKRLKAAKGRDENKPFPLMVYNSSQMHQVAFLNEREEKILKLIAADANITVTEIANKLNVNEKTIKRDITALKGKNILEREGSKKSGAWFLK